MIKRLFIGLTGSRDRFNRGNRNLSGSKTVPVLGGKIVIPREDKSDPVAASGYRSDCSEFNDVWERAWNDFSDILQNIGDGFSFSQYPDLLAEISVFREEYKTGSFDFGFTASELEEKIELLESARAKALVQIGAIADIEARWDKCLRGNNQPENNFSDIFSRA